MKEKTYKIKINASKQHVWDIMLGKETYPQWIKGFSENSEMIGEWKQDTEVDFIDADRGGTRAVLEVVDEPNRLVAKHISGLTKDRVLETKDMENWVGTTEEYVLSEENNVTTLKILMHYHPDFEEMLNEGWSKSLKLLKELCESK
jgi:uncharacterized protein YndB with AHSA1/START domain